MIKYESYNPVIFAPPGSYLEHCGHPCGNTNLSIEEAIFKEHRFAFFYWNKWNKSLREKSRQNIAPTLVSIDWHTDLAVPKEFEREELSQLNLYDDNEVALFCWLRLHGSNDGHIKSAMYLNLFQDLLLLQRQNDACKRIYTDINGNKHNIFIFTDESKFQNFIKERNDENVFLDIDLDYFVLNSGDIANASDAVTMSDKEIIKIFDMEQGHLSPLANSIEGITIATEPDHCWGILNSIHFLETIEKTFFDVNHKWKHLGN